MKIQAIDDISESYYCSYQVESKTLLISRHVCVGAGLVQAQPRDHKVEAVAGALMVQPVGFQ